MFLFFFNDTATTEIYTLSLHDALPICFEHELAVIVAARAVAGALLAGQRHQVEVAARGAARIVAIVHADRKSTRLNSSHSQISYAVFCLKKKKMTTLTCSSVARV